MICDDDKAYLFFTTLNGRMWRAESALASVPDKGWSEPQVALKADIFEYRNVSYGQIPWRLGLLPALPVGTPP